MTSQESFAITQTLELIKLKVEEAFGYVRSDTRGAFIRARKEAINNEIHKLNLFCCESINDTGSEPDSK